MTPQERRSPIVIDGKRRLRIANGSGTTVEQVNQLLEARKQMEKMMSRWGGGDAGAVDQQAPTPLSAGRKSGVKRKKKRAKR